MPDYQAVPKPGDMQFGDPLDFSGLDPSVLLPSRKLTQAEVGGNILASVAAEQEIQRVLLQQQIAKGNALMQQSQDMLARQGVTPPSHPATGINSVHPDVFDALIAAERSGGAAGKSWGQEVSGLVFGSPTDSLNSEVWKP